MKLQTKLIVGFSIILVLVFIVMILFLSVWMIFLNDFNNYKDLSDELNQTSQIETTMLNIQMNVLYYIETSQEKYLKAYKHEKALMDELLYESKKNIVHKERQKIEKIIEKEFSKYDTSFEEITTLILLEDELVNTVLTDIGNRMIFLINSIIKLSEKQNNTKLMLYLSQIQEKIISGRLYVAKYLYENDETRLIVSNYKLKYEMKVLIEKLKPYIASLSKEIKSLWDELLENRLSSISNLTNVVKVHNEANNIIINKLNKSGPDILQEIYNANHLLGRTNKVGINLNSSSDNTKILVTLVIIITVILQ
jgi:CHASE3 domain sensor protein